MGSTNAALELLEHNLRDRPDRTAYLCSGPGLELCDAFQPAGSDLPYALYTLYDPR